MRSNPTWYWDSAVRNLSNRWNRSEFGADSEGRKEVRKEGAKWLRSKPFSTFGRDSLSNPRPCTEHCVDSPILRKNNSARRRKLLPRLLFIFSSFSFPFSRQWQPGRVRGTTHPSFHQGTLQYMAACHRSTKKECQRPFGFPKLIHTSL